MLNIVILIAIIGIASFFIYLFCDLIKSLFTNPFINKKYRGYDDLSEMEKEYLSRGLEQAAMKHYKPVIRSDVI